MIIKPATLKEYENVLCIVHNTIKTIYPNYYPMEVVDFFLEHHSEENIKKDIGENSVYLLIEDDMMVGTGTKDGRYIGRVYVLPQYQGRGYGAAIMSFLENEIAKEYPTSYLDSSLPSYGFYLKSDYKPTEYHQIEVRNNRVLCFYEMEKELDTNMSE